MLLLSNLFPFVNMEAAGVSSEVTMLEIPRVLFNEDYASLGSLFMLFVQLVPAFCLITILLLVNRVTLPPRLKIAMARVLFWLRNWGMAEIFLAGVLVSFVKLIAYGDIALAAALSPGVSSASCSFVLFSASTAAGSGTISRRCRQYLSR
ncbi:Paraquat-inducible protein A [Cronobacter sakazakii 696]|nr:Paraquat-inducible protein A [Cronobacter sakazakii 696]